jgi:glycosyltransferase involved in cell wall biosynthesis
VATSPSVLRREPRARRVGLLSTYPPRMCGLATFAAALEAEMAHAGDRVTIVAVDDGRTDARRFPPRHELRNGMLASVRETARLLSRCDVAIVQHEYGIYGGTDGDEVVDVLRLLDVPAIVVLHTVVREPTAGQRLVLETVCELAAGVVVMSHAAGSRLLASYAVDPAKVTMIPHGAWSPPLPEMRCDGHGFRPKLLTWGLLGPGKGIEHVVSAMSLLGELRPRVRYVVAGVTHPNVFARDGDQYRQSLIRASWAAGLGSSVSFDDAYRDVGALKRLVSAASVVVLPYDSRDQATSGVLVDALAAGRPVISTAFPHAVELLSSGAGILVPHCDPKALAAAILSVVSDPDMLAGMARRALEIAPSLSWATVAAQYRALCDAVIDVESVMTG